MCEKWKVRFVYCVFHGESVWKSTAAVKGGMVDSGETSWRGLVMNLFLWISYMGIEAISMILHSFITASFSEKGYLRLQFHSRNRSNPNSNQDLFTCFPNNKMEDSSMDQYTFSNTFLSKPFPTRKWVFFSPRFSSHHNSLLTIFIRIIMIRARKISWEWKCDRICGFIYFFVKRCLAGRFGMLVRNYTGDFGFLVNTDNIFQGGNLLPWKVPANTTCVVRGNGCECFLLLSPVRRILYKKWASRE